MKDVQLLGYLKEVEKVEKVEAEIFVNCSNFRQRVFFSQFANCLNFSRKVFEVKECEVKTLN